MEAGRTQRALDGGSSAGLGRAVEVHSIDYIPRSERHGKPWQQAVFWFTSNLVISVPVLGFVGPAAGLDFRWSALAVVLGVLFGTFFTAFHANQGPAMGLPQMIQSRAQFGTRGSSVPLLAVVFLYVGYSVFGVIFATQAITMVLPGGKQLWYPIVIGVACLAAIVGYNLLHRMMRWLTFVIVPIWGIVTVLSLTSVDAHTLGTGGTFSAGAFLAQFAVAAAYGLANAVYVSDYSRYLPTDTPPRAIVGWTYLGTVAAVIWLMVLGSFIASSMSVTDPLLAVQQLGDKQTLGFGTFLVVAMIVPSTTAAIGVNAYGAMLAGVSTAEGFRAVTPGRRIRVVGIAVFAATALLIATLMPDDFVTAFSNFMTIILYLLVPWTAINLIDYYYVRRGHYAITEIFNPDGIYGRWGWPGLIAYLVGFVAMVPFMSTEFFVGPVVDLVGGADIAFIIGLLVAGMVYLVLMRDFDPASEADAIRRSHRHLDEPAVADRQAGQAFAGPELTA